MTRITNSMMINDFVKNYHDSEKDLNKYMNQLSTGKKFNQVSEAPLDATRALKLKTAIKFNERYTDNVESGIDWLKSTDESLGDTIKTLRKARDLSVQAANETNTPSDRQKIAKKIDELKAHLVQLGNTKYGDRYIFNGKKTKTKPYQNVSGAYGMAANTDINREIAEGIEVSINVSGYEVGADTDGDGDGGFNQIFNDLEDLSNNITNSADVEDAIENIDSHIEKTLTARAKVGARQKRLEMTKVRFEDQKINKTESLSKIEDVDMAKAIMNLKQEESVHRAALATGARTIQPTLVDFLK